MKNQRNHVEKPVEYVFRSFRFFRLIEQDSNLTAYLTSSFGIMNFYMPNLSLDLCVQKKGLIDKKF